MACFKHTGQMHTGLMLIVVAVVISVGAAGRAFQAAAKVLKGWEALPTATLPMYAGSTHRVLRCHRLL